MSWLKSRLSIRQTAYALSVVMILTMTIASIEIVWAYRGERRRLISIMNQWFESVADTSARAAYHVDRRQAMAVLDGLIKFKTLAFAKITTDRGVVLAERRRTISSSFTDPVASWLFGDIVKQQRALTFDRSMLVPSISPGPTNAQQMLAGTIELNANPVMVGRNFLLIIGELISVLVLEFFLLAATLAFIFHRTLTQPLLRYADQLSRIDPQGAMASKAAVPLGHEHDELGLVVIRTNELLERIRVLREAEELAKEALVHRERVATLGSLLAGVAHELNNPLAILTAQAELLAETTQDQQIRDRAEKILRPAERCARIVRTFLALARQREVKKVPVDVEHLIHDVCELLDYSFKTNNISVSVDIQPDVPTIWGDGGQLSQVLINLLVNAQHALLDVPTARTVHVRVTAADKNLTMIVSDNGPGIPASIRNRIFEPFFTTKAEGHGTGLGLSYCLSVVDNHRGTIEIDKKRATGTAVTVTLPIDASPVMAYDPSIPDEEEGCQPLHVLIIDDEAELLHTLIEQLEHLGHSTYGCSNATAALEVLTHETFDLILSDIRMPGIDGPVFYEEVCTRNAKLRDRFVFITGDSLNERAKHFIETKRVPCMFKPFLITDLEHVINSVIKGSDKAK